MHKLFFMQTLISQFSSLNTLLTRLPWSVSVMSLVGCLIVIVLLLAGLLLLLYKWYNDRKSKTSNIEVTLFSHCFFWSLIFHATYMPPVSRKHRLLEMFMHLADALIQSDLQMRI